MAFPSSLDTLKTTWVWSEAPVSHSNHHNDMAVLVLAMMNKIGVNGSVVTSSLQYQIADLVATKAWQKVSASIDTFVDNTTATKKMRFDISLLTTARVFKYPDRTNEFVVTATTDKTWNIDHVLRWDGTFGLSTTAVPAGSVMIWLTLTAPTGYLLCDWAAVSRTTYAGLFAVISTTYWVWNGTTTFNLPNLQGRVPVGRDSLQTEFDVLGETWGAKTHTLTSNEMPSHRHRYKAPGGNGWSSYGWMATYSGDAVSWAYADTVGIVPQAAIENTWGWAAHNNLQPYIVTNYIIKT